MKRLPTTLLLATTALVALVLLSGCMAPGESTDDVADGDLNNDPRGGGDPAAADSEECISTTTGEPTTDEGANPCPQGRYPGG